jgi:Mg2+ and Co2+ transporter CorA
VVDYSPERMEKYELDNATIRDFVEQPRPDWVSVRWVNVNGLSWDVIQACGNAFDLHRLAIEDLMNPRGRSKVDWYSNQAYSE